MKPPMGHFHYFAFGSNMLTSRIRISNPSANYVGNAALKGYTLDFNYHSKKWRGAVATIRKDPLKEVWGILWALHDEDLKSLDKQEGVADSIYQRLSINVRLEGSDENVEAYTYQLTEKSIQAGNGDKRPSGVYKGVILGGAKEHGLMESYLKDLEAIEDNGYDGEVDINVPKFT